MKKVYKPGVEGRRDKERGRGNVAFRGNPIVMLAHFWQNGD